MKPTILVVEDEPALITLLRYNLEKEGFRVLEAHDGEEALIVTKEERPDLISSTGCCRCWAVPSVDS